MTTSPTASKPGFLRTFSRALVNFLWASIGAYGLSVTGGLLLRLLFDEPMMLVAFYNSFAQLFWVGAAVLLIGVLLLRRWLLVALLILPALMFAFNDLPRLLSPPNPSPDTRQIADFTLLTYNLLGSRGDYSASVDILQAADADILALQEVDLDAAAQIEAAIGGAYPYLAVHPVIGVAGQAVYSRFPILEDAYWQAPGTIGSQRTVIEIAGQMIILHNAHPAPPGISNRGFDVSRRNAGVVDLLTFAAADAGPVILAGDFNAPDYSDDYARLSAGYRDVFREAGAGFGWTFPHWRVRLPLIGTPVQVPRLLRLDYVFTRGDLISLEARVWPTDGGSDHAPVWVRLGLLDRTLSSP